MADDRIKKLRLELLKRELSERRDDRSVGEIITKNLKKAGRETFTEGISPILSGLSTAALGIPRTIARKAGVEEQIFPEQETLGGKIFRAGSDVRGLFQGAAAGLARGIGNTIAPKLPTTVGLSLRAGENVARQKALLANRITRNAIEGSVFGLAQLTPDEEGDVSLGGQLAQGGAGLALGAAFPLVQSSVGKAARGFRKFRTRSKTPSAKKLRESAQEEIALRKEAQRLASSDKVKNIDDAISKTEQKRKSVLFESKVSFNKLIKDTTQRLKENVLALDDALQTNVEEVAQKIQKKLPAFYRSNSRVFGNRLDEIAEGLSKKGDDITIGEVDDMLNSTVNELDDALITEGKPRQAIEFLRNKYKLNIADSGQGAISNVDEVVPLKEFFNDIKRIRNALKSSVRSGSEKFTQDDVAISIFNKNTAEILEAKVPELVQLRSAYAPVIQAMKTSNRIFKPFKGQFETKTGSQLLKRFSLGKTEQGENLLIQAIENGSDFAPGIGRITPQLRQRGFALLEAKTRIQPMLNDMRSINTLARNDIDKRFASEIMKLRARREFILADSIQKEKMLENVLFKRLKEVGARSDMINNLRKDKAKVARVFRNVLFAAGALGGTVGLIKFAGSQQ